MASRKAPYIPDDVVEWLEKVYPNILPALNTPLSEIHAKIGEQRVIARLRQAAKVQREQELGEK
jgi:hypothetical protein